MQLFTTHKDLISVLHLLGLGFHERTSIIMLWYRKEMDLFVWQELGCGSKRVPVRPNAA